MTSRALLACSYSVSFVIWTFAGRLPDASGEILVGLRAKMSRAKPSNSVGIHFDSASRMVRARSRTCCVCPLI